MKTANIPSLRVDPELRGAAEGLLREGETLSGFVEQAIRNQIRQRRLQAEFIAKGLASADEARRTGRYHSVEDVLAELETMLSESAGR